jgi:hypothetical protein
MRRRAVALALAGAGLLAVRALVPRFHARLIAGCERMFEQMPDEFPPKRMLRGIEETRANSVRTLALLEAREQALEAEWVSAAAPSRTDNAEGRRDR